MGKSRQPLFLALIVAVFALFNASLYVSVTRRLSNNFSGIAKAGMLDVGRYLPFEPESLLPRVPSSLHLSQDLPVLDGAAALVPVYAAVVEAVYPRGCVTYVGGVFSDDNYYGENFAADSKMQYHNTVRGYKAVVDGTVDVLFCAGPSQAQRVYAEEKGVTLTYAPIGREGFVFLVNRDNPVSALTSTQIRNIYEGKITNWKQVGGPSRPINPVTRLKGSGSQSAMDAFMDGKPIAAKSPLAVAGGAVGYSFRYYVDGIVKNKNVKTLAVDGVAPTAQNIRNGSYPLAAEFYAVYRTDNPNPNIPVLVDWLRSDEGQALIEECGYVRLRE